MKTALTKTAIAALLVITGTAAVLFFSLDNDANILVWLAERAAILGVGYWACRKAESLYRRYIKTGGDPYAMS